MKVHWIVRLFLYFFVATIAGPFFDNWTSTEKYLYLSDAYSELCTPDQLKGDPTDHSRCIEQQLRVSDLLAYGRLPEYLSSVLIGIVMDRYGPRLVSTFGVLLATLSWILLGLLPLHDLSLKAAFILVGLCTNSTLFPALTIEQYNRKYKSQSTVFIAMSSSFTCFVIKALEQILLRTNISRRWLTFYFLLSCMLPCLLISILLFPNKLSEHIDKHGEIKYRDPGPWEETPNKELNANKQDDTIVDSSNSLTSAPVRRLSSSDLINGNNKGNTKVCDISRVDHLGDKDDKDKPSAAPSGSLVIIQTAESLEEEVWTLNGFLNNLKNIKIIVCCLYYAYNVVSLTFTQQAFTMKYSDDPINLTVNEYLTPFSFVFCLIFAIVYKFVDSIFVILIVNIFGIVANVSALYEGHTSGIIFSVFMNITYSIYNTQIYIYLEDKFNKTYYGSVIGFLNTIGGLSIFINLFSIKLQPDLNTITNICIYLLVIRMIFIVMFTFLMFKDKPFTSKGKINTSKSRIIYNTYYIKTPN